MKTLLRPSKRSLMLEVWAKSLSKSWLRRRTASKFTSKISLKMRSKVLKLRPLLNLLRMERPP